MAFNVPDHLSESHRYEKKEYWRGLRRLLDVELFTSSVGDGGKMVMPSVIIDWRNWYLLSPGPSEPVEMRYMEYLQLSLKL